MKFQYRTLLLTLLIVAFLSVTLLAEGQTTEQKNKQDVEKIRDVLVLMKEKIGKDVLNGERQVQNKMLEYESKRAIRERSDIELQHKKNTLERNAQMMGTVEKIAKFALGASGMRIGKIPEQPGRSCADIKRKNPLSKDGKYWIDPKATRRPFIVYCDMTTDDDGWVLVGRRGSKAVIHSLFDSDFDRELLASGPTPFDNAEWSHMNLANLEPATQSNKNEWTIRVSAVVRDGNSSRMTTQTLYYRPRGDLNTTVPVSAAGRSWVSGGRVDLHSMLEVGQHEPARVGGVSTATMKVKKFYPVPAFDARIYGGLVDHAFAFFTHGDDLTCKQQLDTCRAPVGSLLVDRSTDGTNPNVVSVTYWFTETA